MATCFTAAQLERFRREAKKLSRQLAISHSEALDHVAAEHGFKNWSLLIKHSRRPFAQVQPGPVPDSRTRHYLHGDQHEKDPSQYYCVRCDFFFEASHFGGWHKGAGDADLYLASLERWNKQPARSRVRWTRPDSAPNILAERALRQRAAYEASRSSFHRWLEVQKDRDDPVGDLARDAMRDRAFPVGATTRRQVQDYLVYCRADADVLRALAVAWSQFSAQAEAA